MLNIGANKGYNLVEFLQRYSHTAANLTHANWYSMLMEHGCAAQCCGVCGVCRASRIKQQASSRVQLHAFELQPANARMLQTLVNLAGLPVTVHSTAMSNVSGTVYTTGDVKPGSESVGIARRQGGVSGARQRQLVARPVTTVDAFMAAHAVPRAHFVSIDTEGARPAVARHPNTGSCDQFLRCRRLRRRGPARAAGHGARAQRAAHRRGRV